TRYPELDFTDAVAQVYSWFDRTLRRNRRFINAQRFPTEAKFRAYLRQALLNAARMSLRQRRRHQEVQLFTDEQMEVAIPGSEAEIQELVDLRTAVNQLAEPHRTILRRIASESEDMAVLADDFHLTVKDVVRLYEEALDQIAWPRTVS